jgi:hypothetical protein
VISLSAFSGSAGATTRYVSAHGGNVYPYTTPEGAARKIQSAVDASQDGDEVMVGAGPYGEHVVLKEGVNLSGSASDEVTIYGLTPVKPVLTLTWDNAVKGLTIVGPPYAGIGIYAELGLPPGRTGSFTPFRISDCRITSCPGPGVLVFARQEPSEVLLRPDPRFASPEEWERYLEAIYDTELDVEVSGCQITDCAGSGIVVHIQDLSGKYEGHLVSSPWGGPYGGPIELGFKHATLRMSECTIADCREDGIIVRAGWGDRARVIIDGCVVRSNGVYGVYVSSPGGTAWGAVAHVTNSLLSRNGEAGVWSFSIDDGSWGMMCVEPFAHGNVFAKSSTIAGNSVGIVGCPFPPGSAGGAGPGINLKNCIVFGNADSDIDFTWFREHALLMARGISQSCVGWKELAGVRGNIDSDPLFADPEHGDYRLLPGSPCINAGGMYALPTIMLQDGAAVICWDPEKDLDGNPRISGNGPDMGAYEAAADPPNYLLESSEDLVIWTEEYYGPAASWTDPDAGPFSTKFYRVRVGR